mmetsp:Transcript_5295/g.9628  ORF Transcript_5295/g.9628 Transcript_5295/m.9628 type:complete len:213 (-) Transcript_5295:792-1430(-)
MTQAYDVFVDRILNHLKVSVMGSIVLSRDVEAIRTFCEEAAGKDSLCLQQWEHLRELLCVFVTPPEALSVIVQSLLSGGVISDKDIVVKFLARRTDWRSKGGLSRSTYANEILAELKVMVKEEEAGNAGTMNFGEVPGVSFAEGVKKVESMAKRTGLGFGSGGSFGSSGGGNPFGSGSGIGKNPFGSGGKGFKMPSMSMSKFKMTGWKKSSK